MDKAYTKIFLDEISVRVRIGLLDSERRKAQEIRVNVALFAAPGYLERVTGASIIDYAKVYEFVRGWEKRPHTDLLETFVSDLQAACFEFYPEIVACTVSVKKPHIFKYAASAGVESFVTREAFKPRRLP